MFPPVRGVGGFPLTAMALALGIWGLSGPSTMAQGGGAGTPGTSGVGAVSTGGPGGRGAAAGYAYGGPAYGVPGVLSGSYAAPYGSAGYAGPVYVGYGPGLGIFGPGYPGYGLEYDCGCGNHSLRRQLREASIHNWGAYVLGKECLYPYVADPYSDPRALGFWPPYSAPVAGARTW
jgi:hypothetical protein